MKQLVASLEGRRQARLGQLEPVRLALHRALSGYKRGRSHKTVHASDLTGWGQFCSREVVLKLLAHDEPDDEFVSTSDALVYSLGHGLQAFVTRAFADAGMAVGHWRCRSCGKVHEFCKRPAGCSGCGSPQMQYEEVRFQSDDSRVSGGIDLLLDRGTGKYWVTEVKSLEPDKFKALTKPMPEHEMRTRMYLRLAAESTSPWAQHVHLDEGLVLYAVKAGMGVADPIARQAGLKDGEYSPFKEYAVPRRDSDSNALMDEARRVKTFRQTGVVPPGVCPSSFVKRAQYCPKQKTCFGTMYPAGQVAAGWEKED